MSGLLSSDTPSSSNRLLLGGTPGTQGEPAATSATAPSAAEEAANAIIAREQKRSEAERVSSIQQQLAQETLFRGRGFGLRSLLGSLGGGRRSLLGSG